MKKRILFLNKNFYQYDEQICNNLKKLDFEVISKNITPELNNFEKILNNFLNGKFLKNKNKINQKTIVQDIKDVRIDIVFVLAGQGLSEQTISTLRKDHPNAHFCWYIWDSIENLKVFKDNNKYFDTIISFDKFESKKYGLQYIPLFFINDTMSSNKTYDICMIGQDRTYRREVIKKIIDFNIFNNYYFFLHTGLKEKIKVAFHCDLKILPYLSRKFLSYDDTIKIMQSSRIILDVPSPNQSGLTMRTIETLGIHTKLITTNDQVKYYDFYNSKNICIIDRNNIVIPLDFLNSEYTEIDKLVFHKYSIENWCKQIANKWSIDKNV